MMATSSWHFLASRLGACPVASLIAFILPWPIGVALARRASVLPRDADAYPSAFARGLADCILLPRPSAPAHLAEVLACVNQASVSASGQDQDEQAEDDPIPGENGEIMVLDVGNWPSSLRPCSFQTPLNQSATDRSYPK